MYAVLKIAYFVNEYPKASHSFIRREIRALERQGFEIQRLALRGWDNELPDAEDQAECPRTRHVLRGGLTSLLAPTLATLLRSPLRFVSAVRLAAHMSRDSERPLAYHLIYIMEACRILQWVREFGAERIHVHFGDNSTEIVMLARALGGPPYSFTAHGPNEFQRNWGLDQKIRRSEFAVAISSYGRSQLYLRSDNRDWAKVKVVHCGLERSFYAVSCAPIPESGTIVCVGRLCAAKGQRILVEVVGRIVASGVPVQLVLAGDGPMRLELEQRIKQLDLSGHVRITGWISGEQVRTEMLAARAVVLPSFAEGLPVVLMEAMALRRPVLTTYIAGIPELVRSGEHGWLFPAGSAEALEDALRNCLAMPVEELQKMGDAGFERVTRRHSVDLEASKLAALFRADGASARVPDGLPALSSFRTS
ncbi:MAG TPA: glycosyltransferase family 4 protein [Steroidobacteraceae bacterium]|nr:glycosyltransferase family 4 protein [Steroidobacteraceae bacterium]